jgi:hypothetical protein
VSVASGTIRTTVVVRADHRCEYCRLPTRGQVATFPLDHVIPENLGGPTTLENLALACPCYNGHKWKHIDGVDPVTGTTCRLFNPRADVWADHFAWSASEVGVLEGKTIVGRGTIARLQINDQDLVTTRELLGRLGLFPEVLGEDSPPTA